MPVCSSCGQSFDDQFKFCPFCGNKRPESVTINVTSDDVWETCEIYLTQELFDQIPKRRYFFESTAIGPTGKYAAAKSAQLIWTIGGAFTGGNDMRFDQNHKDNFGTQVPILNRAKCQPKVDAVIKQLVTNGWQPTGRGQEWYSERFRRRAKP